MDVDRRLDGNAAAGLLGEIFAFDVTIAHAICAGCGATHAIGELHVYCLELGAILRCPGCDAAMIRVSRRGTAASWVDLRGLSCLKVAAEV